MCQGGGLESARPYEMKTQQSLAGTSSEGRRDSRRVSVQPLQSKYTNWLPPFTSNEQVTKSEYVQTHDFNYGYERLKFMQ